jgi:ubiquinone/menaquinone biosynthesis C-methylase UbiE
MLHDSFPGIMEKRREIDGWIQIASQHEWYVPNDQVDLNLPFVNRNLGWNDSVWQANEYSFELLLRDYIRPGIRVLEVGAARCWGAMHLLPRGCDYVGTDIIADPNIGLGRGEFYASRFGEFDRIQADGEHLPFRNGYFHITYCCATLHHALNLPRMLQEMARVTRFGGFVIALNEGTRPLGHSGNTALQQTEKEFGINEHVHSMWAYLWAFLQSKLLVYRIEEAGGYSGIASHRTAGMLLRLPRGKFWATLYARNFIDYGGLSLFARKVIFP